MPFVQVRDISINYQIYNMDFRGETIVLIHGLGLNQEVWEPLLPYIQSNYRVILLDLRGHGHSDRGEAPISWSLFIQDLLELFILLELDQVHLLGHGFGASLAVKFSLQYPELVKSLLLLSTPAFLSNTTVEAIIQSRKRLTEISMMHLGTIMASRLCKRTEEDDLYHAIVSSFMTVAPATYYDILKLYAEVPVNEDFVKLAHPALALVGADDSISLAANALSSQLLMHSSILVVPGASHALFIDQPAFVAEKLHAFIQDPSSVKTDYATFERHVAQYVMDYFNEAYEQILRKKAVQA